MNFKRRNSYRPRGVQGRSPEPSESEIRAACEAIQSGWTEAEREARRWWTIEKVDHRGSTKEYRQDAPLDFSLRRHLASDVPGYELPVISIATMTNREEF